MQPGSCQIIYEPSIDVYKMQFGMIRQKGAFKDFIDVLKKQIPTSDRQTSGPPNWEWMIQPKWYDFVYLLAKSVYNNVYTYTKQQYEDSVRGATTSIKITGEEYKNRFNNILKRVGITEGLDEGTDFHRASKIYRKVAMQLHPDRNPGNDEAAVTMSQINECWAAIKEEYLKKEQVV